MAVHTVFTNLKNNNNHKHRNTSLRTAQVNKHGEMSSGKATAVYTVSTLGRKNEHHNIALKLGSINVSRCPL